MCAGNLIRAALLVIIAGVPAGAQTPTVRHPTSGMSYQQAKAWYLTSSKGMDVPTRLDMLRQTLSTGKLGDKGVNRALLNLRGPGAFDLKIPGMQQNVLLMRSGNPNQVAGALRSHLVARSFAGDARFQVIAMNEPVTTVLGKSDKDIVVRHTSTGRTIAIECKSVKLESQARNLTKYKLQIDKMAADMWRTGETKAWVNDKPVHPQLRQYAESKGILVAERARTGAGRRGLPPREFNHALDVEVSRISRVHQVSAAASVGFSLLLLSQKTPELWQSLQACADAETRTTGQMLLLGENASFVVAGAEGLAILVPRLPGFPRSPGDVIVGRYFGTAALVSAEIFMIARYASGNMTHREFWSAQGGLAGGIAGSIAGAELGAVVGSFGGPIGTAVGGVIGGVLGGIGGMWAGDYLAGLTVDYFINRLNAEQQEDYRTYLYFVYEVARPVR